MEFEESIQQWERNSRADPLWSVLSAPEKRGRKWDEAEFYRTGEANINRLFTQLDALGLRPKKGHALDFGCGVGRLTQALAPHFDRVTGLDAAPTMVNLAQVKNRHGEKVRYVVNQSPNLKMFPDEAFDLVLSLIVLQHIPTASVYSYLGEFSRTLAPGGVLVFQIPSRRKSADRTAKAIIKSSLPAPALRFFRRVIRPSQPVIPMHPIPRADIEAFFRDLPLKFRKIEIDDWGGPQWESYTYFAQK